MVGLATKQEQAMHSNV